MMLQSCLLILLLLVVLPVLTTGRPSGCPHGFYYDARVNGCYKAIARTLNWWAASQACKDIGAELVTIENRQEQDAVLTATHTISSWERSMCAYAVGDDTVSHRWGGFWTAGQRVDPQTKSPFVWRSNPSSESYKSFGYTAWCQGQPDFWKNRESCVHLMADCWNDSTCYDEICALCEIKM